MVVSWTRRGDVAAVPSLLVQPVDPADVGDVLARTAFDGPVGTFEVAGPELQDLVDMARRTLTARGEALRPLRPGLAPSGRRMAREALLPGSAAMVAPTTFEQWLATQRPSAQAAEQPSPGRRAALPAVTAQVPGRRCRARIPISPKGPEATSMGGKR
jgi:hypothetical protein